MGAINVKTASLTEVGSKLKRLTNNVDTIGKGFSSVRSSLDSDVKGKSGIGNDLKGSSDDLNNIEKVLRNASRYIDEVVKSYSGDERKLEQFVARMNLSAVSDRSCSSVTGVALEALYRGIECKDAVQALVCSNFFGDTTAVSSDLSYTKELLFAGSVPGVAAKAVKPVSTKAYIQQEKELSWDEILEYASKSPEVGEWAKTVEERIKNSYVPYEAQKGMIDALRPKAMEMWSILEKGLSWDEVLKYASKSPEVGEWAKTVEERIKNSYVPYEAQKGMIDALRPEAMEMWNILENPSNCLVSREEIENYISQHSHLSDIQKEILRNKINEYTANNIIKEHYIEGNSSDPLVMFFEGAVDDDEGYKQSTGYHKDGRFKAMAVVIKEGKIVGVFTDASTLPDDPHNSDIATAKEGVYKFNSGIHDDDYSALRVNDGSTTPATYGKDNVEGVATGINIHMGYNNDNPYKPTSKGCLIINKYTEYNDFAYAVGFKPKNITITEGVKQYINVSGYVVIDRSYMK